MAVPPPGRFSSNGRAKCASNTAVGTFCWSRRQNLAFLDYQVGQKSIYPLSKTPLGPLLSGSADFNGKAQILPSTDPRVVVARAKNTSYGQLTLAFLRTASAPGGLQMYGWTAIDPQGHRTTVKLSNVRYNVPVPESAFTYAQPKNRGNK